MEKERKIKVLSLVALIVAVLGLTVAFAALSQTLTINGTASVNAAEWDIHFENLSAPEITGDARVESEPVLDNHSISNLDVSLTKPGDEVVYTFDIVNNGTIDAYLYEYQKPGTYIALVASGSIDDLDYDLNKDGSVNADDIAHFSLAIDYNLYYADDNVVPKKDDLLRAGETKKLKLVIRYKDTANFVFGKPLKIFDTSTTNRFLLDYDQNSY